MKKIILVFCMIMVTALGADNRIFLDPPEFINSKKDIKKAAEFFEDAALQCCRISIRASSPGSSHTEIRSAVYQMEEIMDSVNDVLLKVREFVDIASFDLDNAEEIQGICAGIEHSVFQAESDCYIIDSLCFQDETLSEARGYLKQLTEKWDEISEYAEQLQEIN